MLTSDKWLLDVSLSWTPEEMYKSKLKGMCSESKRYWQQKKHCNFPANYFPCKIFSFWNVHCQLGIHLSCIWISRELVSLSLVSSNEHTEWNTHECLLVICNIMTNSLIPAKFKCNSGESRVDSVHSRKKKFSKENNLRGNCSASFVGNTFYCRCTPLLILSCTFLPEFNLTRRQVITCRTSATNVLISSGIWTSISPFGKEKSKVHREISLVPLPTTIPRWIHPFSSDHGS